MPTVQDIYDIAVYDEASTESAKLSALIDMISRRGQVTKHEILTWSTAEFFQTAKDIVDAIDPNHVQVPTPFTRAFECQKACCTTAMLDEILTVLNRWVSTADHTQHGLLQETRALGYRINLVKQSAS